MATNPPGPQSEQRQLSPDGRWQWDGTQWVPADNPSSPGQLWSPTMSPLGARPAMRPVDRSSIAYQFSGNALWAIVFGLLSVLVPIFTPIYFPILPLFGLWRAVLAIREHRVAGGAIALVLNGFGCVVSLLSSGLLFR